MTKSIANSFKTFGRSFLLCGLCGWCMEILFTALHSLRRRDLRLTGNTSLWMFPIYGSACLLAPFKRLFEHLNISRPGRGLFYMAMIFTVEYLSGRLLWKHGLCPWDYGKSRFHIHRIIRLDYAPWWFLAGLFLKRSCPEPFYCITALLLPASVPHDPFVPHHLLHEEMISDPEEIPAVSQAEALAKHTPT